MAIEYRKHKSGRQFARIEGDQVVRILNKLESMDFQISNDRIMANAILQDKDFFFPCTEQEFNTAYQEAFDRIQKMKI